MKNISIGFALALVLISQPAVSANYKFATLEFPPMEFAGANGQAEGVAVEIVQKIMKNLGHTVEVNVYPWARGYEMAKSGEVDGIFTAYRTPEREAVLLYSKKVLIPQVVGLYVPAKSDVAFDGDLAKLGNKSIGVVSTISYGDVFEKTRDKLKIERTESLEQNFKKMDAGRLDIIISNVLVADWTFKKMGVTDKLKRLPVNVQSVDSFIAFTKAKDMEALRNDFDREAEKVYSDGTVKSILQKYGINLAI